MALQSIRRSIRRKGEALREQMESILSSLHRKGLTQEELITTRDGRLVIPIRAEFKHQVPGIYTIGGGPENMISLLECIDLIAEICGWPTP